jgi:hypothetical protein
MLLDPDPDYQYGSGFWTAKYNEDRGFGSTTQTF